MRLHQPSNHHQLGMRHHFCLILRYIQVVLFATSLIQFDLKFYYEIDLEIHPQILYLQMIIAQYWVIIIFFVNHEVMILS